MPGSGRRQPRPMRIMVLPGLGGLGSETLTEATSKAGGVACCAKAANARAGTNKLRVMVVASFRKRCGSSQNCPARFLIVLTLLRLKTLKVSLCKILHRGQRHFGEGPPTADSQRYGRISGRYFKVAGAAEQWSRIGVVRRERVPHAEAVELYVASGAWCPRPRRV